MLSRAGESSYARRTVRAAYTPDPAIDSALLGSVPPEAPRIVHDLTRECLRARRTQSALAILVVRVEGGGATQWGARSPINSLQIRTAQMLRDTDLVGMLGDHEILAILPGADLEGARVAADRLMKQARRRGASAQVVVGVDALSPEEDDVPALIARGRAVARAALD